MAVWYGRTHDSRGTDCGAPEPARPTRSCRWEGSFEDYLELVRKNPQVTRNAFQRVYDMIISLRHRGVHRQQEEARPLQLLQGRDARRARRDLRPRHPADAARERAQGRGRRATAPRSASSCCTARSARSKSTIARLLKKGIEDYSRTPEGALYTFDWVLPRRARRLAGGSDDASRRPMHEEPLRLIPREWREQAIDELGLGNDAVQACKRRRRPRPGVPLHLQAS